MRKNALIVILTAVMVSIGGHRAAAQQLSDDPRLDTRITISYQNAPATDVLFALGRAGNLPTNMTTAPLGPVTVTLTNVTLRTALDAVCQNAGCTWRVEHNEKAPPQYRDVLILRITALEASLASIPKTVSLSLRNASVGAVFRALAAAANVTLILETDLTTGSSGRNGRQSSTWSLEDAKIDGVLNLLCEIGNCSWELNETNRTLRVFARSPAAR